MIGAWSTTYKSTRSFNSLVYPVRYSTCVSGVPGNPAHHKGDNMNNIQVLALLALFSMSIPATLAFLMWRERNYYMDELYEADQQYYSMLEERDFYRTTAFDLTGHDDQYVYCYCTQCEVVKSLECPF